MKKTITVMLLFCSVFMFTNNIKAACNDKELNDWAEEAKIEYMKFSKYIYDEKNQLKDTGKNEYAYLLALIPKRSDVIMKATNNYGENLTAENIPTYDVYAIGNYTNMKKIVYKIKVYGSKDSKCPNELLKEFDYSLEPFNYYSKTSYCEDYPEAELCATFKDTSNVTEKEFNQIMEEYDKKNKPEEEESRLDKILGYIREYGIYIVVPFLIITLVYIIKIEEHKKKERKK